VVACLSQIYVDRKRKTLALYMYLLRKIPLDKEMEYIYKFRLQLCLFLRTSE